MPLMQRFMKFVASSGIVPDARLLELYPPFMPMRIKVLEIAEDWRTVRILLPLNARSRNPGGVMFGGYQAALADPIAALACARVFPGYSVWTRAMTISFDHGGNSDLEMRFSLTPEQEEAIRMRARSARVAPRRHSNTATSARMVCAARSFATRLRYGRAATNVRPRHRLRPKMWNRAVD